MAIAVPAQLARALFGNPGNYCRFCHPVRRRRGRHRGGGDLLVTLMPWLALVIGGILVLMGVAMLLGRHFTANFVGWLRVWETLVQ